MFPDLQMLATMMQEPMKEYIEREGIQSITIHREPTRDDTKPHMVTVNDRKLNGSDAVATFILTAFVEMSKGN